MKKTFSIFITVATAALMLSACGNAVDNFGDVESRMLVNPQNVSFVEFADSSFVEVITASQWTAASSDSSWCTVKANRTHDTLRIAVAAKASPDDPDRAAIVTVTTAEGYKKLINVKQGKSEASLLAGEWLAKEDYFDGSWHNGQTYPLVMEVNPDNRREVLISGFAPYVYDEDGTFTLSGEGHTLTASVMDGKITIPCQELLPGWDEPDFRTYVAALSVGTLSANVGVDFPPLTFAENAEGRLQINLRGGFGTYGYMIYDLYTSGGAYAGYWAYTRNVTWVKQD